MNDPENMDPFGPQNHALPYVTKCHEKAQERRQERTRHVSGTRGAENRDGHSAASTGGASDLRCTRCNGDFRQSLDCPACGEFSELGRGSPAWHLVWIAVGIAFWGVIAWVIA